MKMKNKKGQEGIIFFFVLLFLILIIGFIAAIAIGIIDFASDTITPELKSVGVVGSANISEAAGYTFGVTDTFSQALPWLVGFGFVLSIMFSVIFAISYRYKPHPVFIALYFMFIILLIFGSIIMSNVYENIYQQDNELATRLNEQTLTSHMLLFSPFIFTIIAFLTGIYIFAGPNNQGGFS